MAKPLEIGRKTAREVLVKYGGEEHAEHSIARKEPALAAIVRFGVRGFLVTCSCGAQVAVADTQENRSSLRNVFESVAS